ncbi:response regulator [Ensifer adhaerens]|uniref:response regulator n=1 Tax=Ensifer adhaerens TaxID=106592 RepID=UPI000CF0AD15|nr:response regulator [Ensifer adhaerens]
MIRDLQQLRVLVAEDEFIVANDIALLLEEAGATIIGPTPTVQETLKSLLVAENIQVAVLDINLNGELIYPVADELARRSVPLIFFSGYDSWNLPERFSTAARLSKCVSTSDLVSAVFEQHLQNLSTLTPVGADFYEHNIVDLVPGLRLRARRLMVDAAAADGLVERTLERAIVLAPNRRRSQPLCEWLHALMAIIHSESPFGPN